MSHSPNLAFELRIRTAPTAGYGTTISIRAYDHNWSFSGTHGRLDVEVRHGSVVVFPLGQLHCAVSHAAGHSSDGIEARALVMSLVAMKPGDTDPDYFDGYTPEQLAWCEAHGDLLDMIRQDRYCDENGNVRKAG